MQASLRYATQQEFNERGAWLIIDIVMPTETRSIDIADNGRCAYMRRLGTGRLRFPDPTTLAVMLDGFEVGEGYFAVVDLKTMPEHFVDSDLSASAPSTGPVTRNNVSPSAVFETSNGGRYWEYLPTLNEYGAVDFRPVAEDGEGTAEILDPAWFPIFQIDSDHWLAQESAPARVANEGRRRHAHHRPVRQHRGSHRDHPTGCAPEVTRETPHPRAEIGETVR